MGEPHSLACFCQFGLVKAAGQKNTKPGTLIVQSIKKDKTLTLFDNTVDRRKTKATPFASLLSCEEWFEYLIRNVLGDTNARIRQLNKQIVSPRKLFIAEFFDATSPNVASKNCEFATVWHGIPSVDGEIHDHLLDL